MSSSANVGTAAGSDVLAALVRLVADRAAQPSVHRKKICILLGAGADFSSGGLSFAELKRQSIVEFTKRPLFDVTLPEQIEARFEQLFLSMPPDERALLVEALFERMRNLAPSDVYKVLVLLAEAGGIDAIVTTNFDTMLERAQHQLGRDLFQVFAPGLARPYLISETRFELPRKPYLKLHGDIASRSVTLLTSAELAQPQYDASMLELLRSVLSSHDLVLTGYSGYDRALAQIIADALKGTENRVFWCNPRPPAKDSPLYSLIADRTRFVAAGFDDLVMAVARPTLERPSLVSTEPTYLRCLFEWRIEYCNREYFQSYTQRNGKSLADIFARRRSIEDRMAAFLRPNHPLAIITGPSGFGKSTIGVRLGRIWTASGSTRIMLVRSRTLPENGDIEQHVAEQLGGLGSRGPFSLFKLERWLREQDLRLVVFVDGLNEFSSDLQRCVQLLRQILRFCYFLPEQDSALRIIATVRQETWNLMLPHLDMAQLRRALWVEGNSPHALSTIACGPFTDDEVTDALTRLRIHGYASISTTRLSPSGLKQLRDPYLLGTIADGAQQGLGAMPTARIYQQAFEAKLQRRSSHLDGATLKDILANLAIKSLDHPQDRFREIDVQPSELRGEIVRTMKDLHIFADAGEGFLQFAHDRTLEYFAAVGFAARCGPSLETLDELSQFLAHYRTHGKALAAARLYFQLAPAERFPLIEASLRLMDEVTRNDRERLFGFAREVLVEMAEQSEPFAEQFLADAIAAAAAGRTGEHQLRTIVQAAASLSLERAIPLLTRASHAASALARTEANIYAADKLVKHFLRANCPATSELLRDEPFAAYFADGGLAPWQRLGRLLGFAAQLGPDNTHPEEYSGAAAALSTAFARLRREERWTVEDAKACAAHFVANCDRLLFNATASSIDRFFGNPQRQKFAAILERLAAGEVLAEEDLAVMEGHTQSLASSIE